MDLEANSGIGGLSSESELKYLDDDIPLVQFIRIIIQSEV